MGRAVYGCTHYCFSDARLYFNSIRYLPGSVLNDNTADIAHTRLDRISLYSTRPLRNQTTRLTACYLTSYR